MSLKLIIGNKNYSSWSFRPWIAMRHIGLDFEEEIIPLFEDGYKAAILAHSPAGQVPVLVCDGTAIWGSVVILEFLAEKYLEKKLWPETMEERARARAIIGEMHSGFGALRGAMPMNIRRKPSVIDYDEDVAKDIRRIEQIWAACRAASAGKGPFLFGDFCNADAVFAPVVNRLHIYDVRVGQQSRAYMEAMMALPAWRDWAEASKAEPWIIKRTEL